MSTDVVCGMTVSADAGQVLEFEGRRYAFCGAACRKLFASNPRKYADPAHVPSMRGALLDWLRSICRVRPG